MLLPPPSAPIATGWSDICRAGFAPAEEWCLLTAHGRVERRRVAGLLSYPKDACSYRHPAIILLSRSQLIRDLSLTKTDLLEIATCRADPHRLSFAYQIGFVRVFHRFAVQQPLALQAATGSLSYTQEAERPSELSSRRYNDSSLRGSETFTPWQRPPTRTAPSADCTYIGKARRFTARAFQRPEFLSL